MHNLFYDGFNSKLIETAFYEGDLEIPILDRPKEWIIPSNPKYFDIVHAFDHVDEINWKQGAGIKKGDTVFMYVGAPVSAVLYKCRVMTCSLGDVGNTYSCLQL